MRLIHVIPEQTIAIAATFTAEPLEGPIKFWLDELGISAEIKFAAFSQVFQELLDPTSLFNRNTGGMNVVLIRPEDWCNSQSGSLQVSGADYAISLQDNVTGFISALRTALECSRVPFLVCLCHNNPQQKADVELNNRLACIVDGMIVDIQALPGVDVVTTLDLESLYPVPDYYDTEQNELASIPYTSLYYVSLATVIIRRLYSHVTPDTKVIVLDCDNTLWKGVCGEEGAHGVDIDFASRMLQEFMVAQYDSGVILCLCSKNNEQDVKDVFDLQVDMPLGLKHFVSTRINWLPKSGNLVSLSEELGLSLDSFVFVDDDPVECDEVRTRCPSVTTLQLPHQRPRIPGFLRHAWVFDHSGLTREAGNRSTLYQHNAMRKSVEAGSDSLEDFLARLQLSIEIVEMKVENIPRVAELFNRTNQFNATTVRYSENEIQSLFRSKEKTFLVTTAKDRFGDYGLVGVTAYSIHRERMNVDSLLLSCRALGRRIEHAVVSRLAEIAEMAGCSLLSIQYRETGRNHLVRNFLVDIGAECRSSVHGEQEYLLPVRACTENVTEQ